MRTDRPVTGSELLHRLFRSVDSQPTRAACELIQDHGNVCALHAGHESHCFPIPPDDGNYPYPFSEAIVKGH